MEKKLSIIIPCYNSADTIWRCLDSIPDREDIEVIAIDDGSTDRTGEILADAARHNRYNMIACIYPRRDGVSSARNIGILKARGKYITFLDSDDEYIEGAVETMLKVIDDTNTDIIQFNHLRDGKNVPSLYANSNVWELEKLPPKWVLVWNKIYKREFIAKNIILFPEGQQFEEDRIFNFECFRHMTYPRIATNAAYTVNKHRQEDGLCHSVSGHDILVTAQNELEMLRKTDNPQLAKLILKCLSDLISSKNMTRLFGGEK